MTKQKKIYLGLGGISLLAIMVILNPFSVTDESTGLILEEKPIQQILSATGKVVPQKAVDLQSQISGTIESLPFSQGEHVNENDIIAIIDDEDAQSALIAAQINLTMAEESLRDIEISKRTVARESLDQIRIAKNSQQELYDDYKRLFEEGAIDQQMLESAQATLEKLESQYVSANASYAALLENGSGYESALTAVRQAQNGVLTAELRVDKHIIRSPLDGIVTVLEHEVGEIIQPGMNLATIITEDRFYVELDIDERNISLLSLGQPATVWPEGFPSKTIEAVVERIDSKVNANTGTVQVRLELLTSEEFIIQDLTVRTDIEVRNLEKALVIPAEYLYTDNPTTVLLQKDEVQIQDVLLEAVGLKEYLVLEGLVPGDVILYPDSSVERND